MGGDEIGDYRAAVSSGYEAIIGSYGFDHRDRLLTKGQLPAEIIFDDPESFYVRH